MIAAMNWPNIISAIHARGMSQPQIAAKCGCAQSTISDIAAGHTKDPRFSIGKALLALAGMSEQEFAGVQAPPEAEAQAATRG